MKTDFISRSQQTLRIAGKDRTKHGLPPEVCKEDDFYLFFFCFEWIYERVEKGAKGKKIFVCRLYVMFTFDRLFFPIHSLTKEKTSLKTKL